MLKMLGRRRALLCALVLAVTVTGCTQVGTRVPAGTTASAPKRLSDAEFWRLVTEVSEPSGTFPSDNYVSNETWFQQVIPRLIQDPRRGGAYLGVGPDQNFTYIVALRPQVAFILDIRRQNMVLHLMYKALIEMSRDRAEFLSRLFARERPAGLGRQSSAASMIRAYSAVTISEKLFQENLRAIRMRLVERHRFALTAEDLKTLTEVYTAFARNGPDIQYSIRNGPRLRFPTYGELIQLTDAEGVARSYLATEELFSVLKDMQEKNLIVPVVGDFAGNKALPALGTYLTQHGLIVKAFYLSNVEMYLFQSPTAWRLFYANLARLPIDERSAVIRSYNLRQDPARIVRIQLATVLDSIGSLVRAVRDGQVLGYVDVVDRSR
jgi:hypothetical protein